MTQTLDATLAAAQDSIDRRPIVKITSAPVIGDIPFAGIPQAPLPAAPTGYTYIGYEELHPYAFSLSNGEAVYVSIYGYIDGIDVNHHHEIRLVTTRDGRTAFNAPVVLNLAEPDSFIYILPNDTIDSQIAVVELPNGNLGLTFLTVYGNVLYGHVDFHAAEITLEGVQVYPATANLTTGSVKETYTEDDYTCYWSGPSTIQLQSGVYLSVFVHLVGSDYKVWKKTSSDFRTWAARTECVLPLFDLTKQISNVSITQLSDGTVLMLFDYTEAIATTGRLRNLYYSTSTDDGANWAEPVKITAYDNFNTVGMHPIAVQKADGTFTLIFTELQSVLTMDVGTLGWPGSYSNGKGLSWDPVNRKLYAIEYTHEGTIQGVIKIDVDTWTIDDSWTTGSVPAFPVAAGTKRDTARYDENLIAIVRTGGVDVLDGEADSITSYQFYDDPGNFQTKNVDNWPSDVSSQPYECQIDKSAMRLYLIGFNSHPYTPKLVVGYIDLTDAGPTYEYHEILRDELWSPQLGFPGDWRVIPSIDMVVITSARFGGTPGCMRIYQLSTGALIKHLQGGGTGESWGYPYWGIASFCYKDGKIYGNFEYTADYGQQDRRGIVEVDLYTYVCNYFRPSYATQDSYDLYYPIVLASGEILFEGWSGQGVVLWDPATSIWTQYLSSDIPGLPTDTWQGGVAFDELTGTIFANADPGGVAAFNRDGFLYRSKYIEANFTTEWEFSAAQLLTQNWKSYDAVAALGPDGTMMVFWSNETTRGYRTIVWDQDSGTFDLSDYIARGQDITFSRSISGKPSSLEFTLTHGHLFDPTNRGSVWQKFLKKPRKLYLSFGEKVSGVDYWVVQGTFLVVETEVKHAPREYPTMRVKAEDFRSLWENMNITSTPHYEGFPEDIISTVLQNLAGVDAGDISLPTFRWRYEVWVQWLDTSVKKMIDQIANRFGYALTISVDGKVRAIKVAGDNPVDHTYSDVDMILGWTPDDSFSDFTNRVVVIGESRDFLEVLYQEEMIKQLMGTVGWWGHKTVLRIYYSEDESRRCRYPRLDIIESVRNFNFKLGGGGESLSATDPDERWVEITVEMPDLVGVVVADVAAILALGVEALIYPGGINGVPGWLFFAITLLLGALFYVVGSIAQYQYSLFARPIGHERLSIQSALPHGNDLVMQTALGKVVEKKIEEPLCITAAQCNEYADYELSIIQFQRNRIRFSKIAHLQDDEGDTLQVPQPYSGIAQRIFVTDIVRKMKIPADPESTSDGYFNDEIEGWVVA
jgi:hypothetical protein